MIELTPSSLQAHSQQLMDKSPEDIIRWALEQSDAVIASTSFSRDSALMLHLISQVAPSIPVVWVDHGYNLPNAYMVAEELMQQLPLAFYVFNPLCSAERRNALMGGIPAIGSEHFERFVDEVKLEPFNRAIAQLKPLIWINGMRKEETDFRKNLDILSTDSRGLLKVAPIFHWTSEQVEAYFDAYPLPRCKHYFDPTKVHENRECGLHV